MKRIAIQRKHWFYVSGLAFGIVIVPYLVSRISSSFRCISHLEARSESVRVRSANTMIHHVTVHDVPVFVLGDLNSTPPNLPYSGSDEHGNNCIAVLDAAGLWQRNPQDVPILDDQLTFPSMKRRSVIDWILIPREARLVNYEVVDSLLSDHCPVVAEVMP